MKENSNFNQDTKSTKNMNPKLIGIIAVLTVALIVVSVVFFIFVQRSPKATVKQVAKAVQKADGNQLLDTVDPIGILAYASCYSYSSNGKMKLDFEDFEDNYEKIVETIKDGKYSVKVTETEKDDDCKKITKVTCDISAEFEGAEIELDDIGIYTMKKGFKNYIVGVDINSLEEAIDEVDIDELEEILY